MARPQKLPPLSEAQLEIMQLVWKQGEISVAEIWNELAARRKIARNTVSTLVTRLEEKGWLRHRTVGNHYVFSATVQKEDAASHLVTRLVDAVFEGSADRLVMALLDGRGVSADEARRIRALIRQAERNEP